MRKTVTKPEKTAAAHDPMTGGNHGVPPTPMQAMQEAPAEQMNFLQRLHEMSARQKKMRLLTLLKVAMAAVVVAAAVEAKGVVASLTAAAAVAAVLGSVLTVEAVVMFFVVVKKPHLKTKLLSPPGSWARIGLRFVFSKKTFDNVYAQAIADMREEHAEALAHGRPWKARWVVLAYHLDLVLTLGAWFGTSVVQRVVGLWKIGF